MKDTFIFCIFIYLFIYFKIIFRLSQRKQQLWWFKRPLSKNPTNNRNQHNQHNQHNQNNNRNQHNRHHQHSNCNHNQWTKQRKKKANLLNPNKAQKPTRIQVCFLQPMPPTPQLSVRTSRNHYKQQWKDFWKNILPRSLNWILWSGSSLF